jgi:hypothetical protein
LECLNKAALAGGGNRTTSILDAVGNATVVISARGDTFRTS